MTDPQGLPYGAAIPIMADARRRQPLTRGIHHGWMREAPDAETVVLFRVLRDAGDAAPAVAEEILGWQGACWTPLRDAAGEAATIETFRASLAGSGRFFDPFTSPFFWKTARKLDPRKPASAQVRRLPELAVEQAEEFAALAHAARIADRLAVVRGMVCMKVPAPMWHVTADLRKPSQLWDLRCGACGTMTPEWSPPPLTAIRIPHSAADKTLTDARILVPSRSPQSGFFVSWRRFGEMQEIFGRTLKIAGRIDPVDAAAAAAATDRQTDLAISANFAVTESLHHLGADIAWMDDREVECWLHARAIAKSLDADFYGNPAAASEAFAAIESIFFDGTVESFAGNLEISTRICRKRWEIERETSHPQDAAA